MGMAGESQGMSGENQNIDLMDYATQEEREQGSFIRFRILTRTLFLTY